MKIKNYTADIITALRIPLSIAMLFFKAFSAPFTVLYIIAGLTDVLDGFIARRTKTESDFGSRLDTVADIIFFGVVLYRIIPILKLSVIFYIWLAIIALIKILSIFFGLTKLNKFVSHHSILNKIAGVILYFFPLFYFVFKTKLIIIIVLIISLLASVTEFINTIKICKKN